MSAEAKFGRCKEIAIAVSKEIPDSAVVFGLYFPITPKDKWDERWRNATQFTHFWVEYEKRIIDAAKEQFGEPFVSIIPADDVRYVRIGILNVEEDLVLTIVKEPKIQWDTMSKNPLQPTKIEWAGYDDHMKIINRLRKVS